MAVFINQHKYKSYYPICRQELLDDEHQWSFAVASIPLNVDAGYTAKIAYTLPSDIIKTFQLESGERFYIEGDHLFTNDPAPILRYVRDIKDLARLPPSFKIALSYLLAARIAGPLSQSEEKQTAMLKLFESEKEKAIRNDLQQHRIEKRPDFQGSIFEAR